MGVTDFGPVKKKRLEFVKKTRDVKLVD